MKNTQLDSVLLTLSNHERLTKALAKTNHWSKTDFVDLVKRLPPSGNREVYTLAQLKYDLKNNNEIISKFKNEQYC